MKIYLAGPINGKSDAEANGWRSAATEALAGHEVIDPMVRDYRGMEDMNVIEIVHGDLDDITGCDAVLANCWAPSYGTSMELVYAYQFRKRIAVVVPPGSRVSPWLRYHATEIFESVEDAIKWL